MPTAVRLVVLASVLLAAGCDRGKKDEPTASPASSSSVAAAAAPAPQAAADGTSYGKPGEPIHLSVGYQPYYSEAWSGVVINGLGLWKKYLPPGSTVDFSVGLQGAIVINAMLAGKEQIGYVGDMPGIVGATKRGVADLRIVANIGLGTTSATSSSRAPTRPRSPTPRRPSSGSTARRSPSQGQLHRPLRARRLQEARTSPRRRT